MQGGWPTCGKAILTTDLVPPCVVYTYCLFLNCAATNWVRKYVWYKEWWWVMLSQVLFHYSPPWTTTLLNHCWVKENVTRELQEGKRNTCQKPDGSQKKILYSSGPLANSKMGKRYVLHKICDHYSWPYFVFQNAGFLYAHQWIALVGCVLNCELLRAMLTHVPVHLWFIVFVNLENNGSQVNIFERFGWLPEIQFLS